jgi:UDP-4-amino-4,6-dideoxy-N-acetyl-beta-L-altrosamine transaminase
MAFSTVRPEWLPYSTQSLDSEDEQAVLSVLRSNWLTQGPVVQEFESRFAEYVGCQYAVAFSNGTQALVAAHQAVGVEKGHKSITTPLTFAATPNSALLAGGKPIFGDIQPDTGLLAPESLADIIDSDVHAIVPVHYGGACCDMDAISAIAHPKGIAIIEDACHALGATYKDRQAGSLSDVAIFSFHPVKPITTAEGGMATTNNPEIYKTLKSLATHGIVKDEKCAQIGPWYYEVRALSTNSRMSELSAALGVSQLKKADSFLEKRQSLAASYDSRFAGNEFFQPTKIPTETKSAYHLYPLLVSMDKLGCSKKVLVESLHQMNIGVQVHYIPVFMHPLYQTMGYTDCGLENSVKFYEAVISIPLFPAMTSKDQDDVIKALDQIVDTFGV